MLDALVEHYERLRDRAVVPEYGFGAEKISFVLVISPSGYPISIDDIRDHSGKQPRPQLKPVPIDPEVTRTSSILAFPLWDKTAYALGVTAGAGNRLAEEHAAFKVKQHELFDGCDDEVIRAFLAFIDAWSPEQLVGIPGYTDDVSDTNVVFRLEGAREYLHERQTARRQWREHLQAQATAEGQCLVTGDTAPLASGHPRIREVNGAQSSGASLISFNITAFESYGKKGNDNAPISKSVAFAYTTALNHLLRRGADNHQRLQIGDATTVFWAATQGSQAREAEGLFAALLSPPSDEIESDRLRSALSAAAEGRALSELTADLDERTRFYVLGLSPNAARLSVRFWLDDTLGAFVRRLRTHFDDLWIEPHRWMLAPALWRLLYATAAQGKAENIPPQLAGELLRAILTGGAYPRSLLVNSLMRMRADGEVTDVRVALCKAILAREARLAARSRPDQKEVPVTLDRDSIHPGYRLGRLFAELENAQRLALGNVNAPIRDRYFGAASATPASVFPLLLRGVQSHLSKLRKEGKGGLAYTVEGEISEIVSGLEENLPRSLRIQDQGHFAIGYYHQSHARFTRGSDKDATEGLATEQGE